MTFRPGLMTSGLVLASFPCDLSAQAEGDQKKVKGISCFRACQKNFERAFIKVFKLIFSLFSESWLEGHKGLGIENLLLFTLSFAV